jgi:hypothetical protein
MRHRDVKELLYEYIRGELDAGRSKQIQEHLARCNRCFAEYQILKEGVRIVPRRQMRPSEKRAEGFWHNFPLDVEERLQVARRRMGIRRRFWDEAEWFFLFQRPYAIALSTSVALVVLAAILWFGRISPIVTEPPTLTSPPTEAQRVDAAVGDYLRRSKILLVGITNMTGPEGQPVDLSVEREAARGLLRQARYLDRQSLDERSRQLIMALERILIELANMKQQADLPDVEIVRSGIHQENMLFRIRMAELAYEKPSPEASRIKNIVNQ